MRKVIVKLENVSKCFIKDKYVIKNLDLEVYEGEFLTFLGSSGCGKTTILRMISGLESVSSGKVYIDGIDVTNLDPTKREVNTIFQNFALFPHMTVFENIAFGLRMQKRPKKEIISRVNKVIKLVELEGLENRYPSQISGGQQQRVAIARGIVMNPKVLLLDESLASLDLKLKRQMQIELKKIQKKLGITFIYVTHDQDEALTMSDRIIIIENGLIEQEGTPSDIYRNPKSAFVADFIGESNIFYGEIEKTFEDSFDLKITNSIIININKEVNLKTGDKLKIMIRPEDIKISHNELKNSFKGIINDVIYDGAITKLFINLDNLKVKVNTHGVVDYKEKETIYLKFDKENIVPLLRSKNEKSQESI